MATLSNPMISWRKGDNSADMASWSLGTIDAGATSIVTSETNILIWNNYNNSTTDVKTAYDCKLGTTDINGTINDVALPTPDIVKLAWTEVQDTGNGDTGWHSVGANASLTDFQRYQICANGDTVNVDGTYSASPTGDPTYPYPILGVKNAGNMDDKANYAKIKLRTNIPPTAGSGTFQFLVKLWYSHI